MGHLISKIVLTGGPCAGKTTALSKIEENLTELGFHVFIVSESATELIKGGIRPFGNDSVNMLDFQQIIVNYQLQKEKSYENAVNFLPNNSKCVIIYDRGVIDNKAYIGQDSFNIILNKLKLNELDLMDNYDMIIHLVTAADGKESNYTLDNNSARKESVAEAIELDRKTLNAWMGHSNLKIIDNTTDFSEKMNRVLDEINNLIGGPVTIKKQRKYLVDLKQSKMDSILKKSTSKIEIEQTYLNMEKDYEKRLKKRIYNNQNTYYLTIQKKDSNGISKIVTDKKISEKDYLYFLSTNEIIGSLSKTRYSFTHNKQYFKLDIFENGICTLEVDPTIQNKKVQIPNYIKVTEDITDNKEFYNINLVKNDKKLIKK